MEQLYKQRQQRIEEAMTEGPLFKACLSFSHIAAACVYAGTTMVLKRASRAGL